MSKNNILTEYLNNEYNKNKNYNFIYSKIKNKNNFKKRILNAAAVLFVIVISGVSVTTIQAKKNWAKEYEKYKNRFIISAQAHINDKMVNNEVENLNMDYLYKDGIGIKINSLVITDYTCQMDIDIKVIDENKKNNGAFTFGFAIYDDEHNIYDISERLKFDKSQYLNYEEKLCKELGIKYNARLGLPKLLSQSCSLNPILAENDNIIMRLELKSKDVLPKTEKLYVRIFDIGYTLADISYVNEKDSQFEVSSSENFRLSDSEWQFEIEIPEEFYDKTYTELEFAENIDTVKLNEAILSETNLSMIIDTKYSIYDIVKGIVLLDEMENTYEIYNVQIIDDNKFKLIFNMNENILDRKLYLYLNFPEENINSKMELIKK